MSRLLLPASAVVLAALAGVAAQEQQPVFRTAAETVRVFVTVTDGDGRLVTTLTRDQFEVRDEGRPQPLTIFDNTPQPIQLVVLLDTSGSMAGNVALLRASAEQLFARLRDDDVVKVGTFGLEVTISETFTRDVAALRAALPAEIPANAPTPLWRAVDQAIAAFDPALEKRRVILVLSDGKDSGPIGFRQRFVSQIDVIERARAADVMVYGIGLRSRFAGGAGAPGLGRQGLANALTADWPDPGLARAAEESGGGYAEIRPRDDLGAAFARVADELHSQYLLGFAPPARDGKVHDVEVRVSGRGLKSRARKSYVAPKAQ